MRNILVIVQIIKHIIVGGFATIADLAFFIFLSLIFPGIYQISSVIIKGFSFLFAAIIKYLGNKFWTFRRAGEQTNKISRIEFAKFLITNLIGLAIDVLVFYLLTKVTSPQFGISFSMWEKLSVLISAVLAGIWNFCGDKFFVFKK